MKKNWFEKLREVSIAKHGPDWWKNVCYMQTHTKKEWLEYLEKYCAEKHPERLERIKRGKDD